MNENPQEMDDLLQELCGCRFGDEDNCTPETHPDCHEEKSNAKST